MYMNNTAVNVGLPLPCACSVIKPSVGHSQYASRKICHPTICFSDCILPKESGINSCRVLRVVNRFRVLVLEFLRLLFNISFSVYSLSYCENNTNNTAGGKSSANCEYCTTTTHHWHHPAASHSSPTNNGCKCTTNPQCSAINHSGHSAPSYSDEAVTARREQG